MLHSMGAVLARQVRRFRAGVERLPITFRVFPSPVTIQSNDRESCVNEIAPMGSGDFENLVAPTEFVRSKRIITRN